MAAASLSRPFGQTQQAYRSGWAGYDAGLRTPPPNLRGSYNLSANVLKASEDKTFPGAIVASLASPWGQSVPAGVFFGGQPSYFGSYREVFARDLYEAFTGLLADGDISTARAATRFLFERQQLADGSMPRNSLLNGKPAPDTGGTQLDEAAYPILMAYLAGLGGDAALWKGHIEPAADFLVAHGPSDGVERWEEQTGYSPSTIAAEIAGLTAASAIAASHGDTERANLYQATADYFQRSIKRWTVTTSGPDGPRYFIRLSKTGDPNAAISYNLGNGGPTLDQRAVIDGGFQELTRLGELPVSDPDVRASLTVLDKQISVPTPSGTGYYRYGNDAAQGSADGYGDCYQPSQTSCQISGAPWPPTGTGTGHLWPNLSGERAESDLAAGDHRGAQSLLQAIINFSSGVGLVPEQDWENPNLPASPYGSDPATASIGFIKGQAAGLGVPADLGPGPGGAADRSRWPRAATWTPPPSPRRVTSPTGRRPRCRSPSPPPPTEASLAVSSTTVTGHTTAGSAVTVASADTTTGAPATVTSTTAAADGSFSAVVPVGFGSNVITVSATANGGRSTGYAQVTVTNEGGGSAVLDVTDPAGDDNGPGTYQYPTSDNFHPGAFDLTRFQVLSDGTTAYLRATLAQPGPDVRADRRGAAARRLRARAGRRVHLDRGAVRLPQLLHRAVRCLEPAGRGAGLRLAGLGERERRQRGHRVRARRRRPTRRSPSPCPRRSSARPGSGWGFSVVLTGQDGFSSDQARAFTPTAGAFPFGVCAPGGAAPICSVDPGTVPKAVDVITPAGVSQATELDPTLGPVVIQPVTVP